MDDDELTRDAFLAAAGDKRAARRFVAGTQPQVHRLLSFLSSPAAADDLTQETYLRAFAALPGYAGRAPARLWLLSIAKRVAADELRARKRRPQLERDPDATAGARTPDHTSLVVLQQLVDSLDPDRRAALVLTQLLGLSYEEAAQLCGCAVGTIRSRVFRARQDLIPMLDVRRPASSDR